MTLASPVLRITLSGMLALALAMGIGRFAFTPLLPLMLADKLIDIGQGGWLASANFLGYLMGAVSATWLRLPPRAALRAALLAIGFATLGAGLTDSYPLWLAMRWLCGLSSAWVLMVVSNYTMRALAQRGRAELQGWVFSGVGSGIAVAGLACLGFMAGGIDSLAAWRAIGTVTLALAIALSLLMGPEIPPQAAGTSGHASGRSPIAWRLVIAYAAAGIGYIIPATYLPVMAREIVASPLVFGWSWPMFGGAAFVSTLLVARLQDSASNRSIWAISQCVMAVGLMLAAIAPDIVTIIIAGLCVGGTLMVITLIGMKEVHRIVPADDAMRHIAVMTIAFASGQMIGPVFASSLHQATGSFTVPLLAASGLLLLTAGLLAGKTPGQADGNLPGS